MIINTMKTSSEVSAKICTSENVVLACGSKVVSGHSLVELQKNSHVSSIIALNIFGRLKYEV